MTADQIQQCKDKLLLIQEKHQELITAFEDDDYQEYQSKTMSADSH